MYPMADMYGLKKEVNGKVFWRGPWLDPEDALAHKQEDEFIGTYPAEEHRKDMRDLVDSIFEDGGCCADDCPFFGYHLEPDGEGGVDRYRACNLLDTDGDYELCQGLEE